MIRVGKELGTRIFIACIALVVGAITWQAASGYFSSSSTTLYLGRGTFSAQVLSSQSERNKGLSGTSRLPDDRAMLFVFESSGKWGIWMKDMNYAIDIVWLDESKTVVHYEERVSPSTYPRIFKPSKDARYVVEFNSGTIDREAISIGQQADFAEVQGEV